MAKFWMNDRNNTAPENNFDIDIDNDYYKGIDSTGNLYGDEFDTVDTDVKVVEPEEDVIYKVLYAPEDCECRGEIVDSLMAGRVVVINVADMDKENMFRLFDYVMGALQALGGEMKRYNKKVVALFPEGVDVETPLDEIEDEPYDDYEEEIDED